MSSSVITKLKSYAGLINDILNDNQITINTISSCSTTGPQGPQGPTGASFGNTLTVDAVYGNDSTASVGGLPYLTIQAAIAAASSGQMINVLAGTYTLTSGITIPNGVTMYGTARKNTIIQLSVTTTTTMITMGENCIIENFTLNFTGTGTNDNITLTCVLFSGTTSQTSSLERVIINVNNSTMLKTLTNNVYGINASGTGTLSQYSFRKNAVKTSVINVYSNGQGIKRGILISGSNPFSTTNSTIFVDAPINTDSTGSYVGAESADANNIGTIQLRSTTVGVKTPTVGQTFTASDILQTNPTTIINPSYLLSPGIQIGPGTDLITKSAGGKGFSTYVYPTIIFYGLKGAITSASNNSYLWPGTQSIANNNFPDPTLPAAYFRVQQPALLSGLFVSTNVSPGGTNTMTFTIYYTPLGGSLTITPFTVTLTDGQTSGTFYNSSINVNTGDFIHLHLSYTSGGGGNSNQSNDITAQIDLF